MSFFGELKRRNVFRVGIAYLIGAWLLLQIADVVLNIRASENSSNYFNLPGYWDQVGWPNFCQRKDDGRIVCQ